MTTAIKEKPVIFSSEMVRAILDNRKTQTRRVIKPQPDCFWTRYVDGQSYGLPAKDSRLIKCPFGEVGDEMWVRETWMPYTEEDDDSVDSLIRYRADQSFLPATGELAAKFFEVDQWKNFSNPERWRPSIHMPRWASRIQLRIVNVRVERVQDMSATDAVAEGLQWKSPTFFVYGIPESVNGNPVESFRGLWDSINGDRDGCKRRS